MKRFKEFNKKPKNLSWEGHEFYRGSVTESFEGWGSGSYSREHDHPDIKPQNLTHDHIQAIEGYTSADHQSPVNGHRASIPINNELAHAAGEPDAVRSHHPPKKVQQAIRDLASAFTPENTNKTTFKSRAGIPQSIGLTLQAAGIGSRHIMTRFVSSSTSPKVSRGFSNKCALRYGHLDTHELELSSEPGVAMTVAAHSSHPEEEVLLNHGTPITFNSMRSELNSYGGKHYTYSVTAHATGRKQLSDYNFQE